MLDGHMVQKMTLPLAPVRAVRAAERRFFVTFQLLVTCKVVLSVVGATAVATHVGLRPQLKTCGERERESS